MKILHLIVDHQVIERTLGIYEKVFPGSNDVLLFPMFNENREIKHLDHYKSSKYVKVGEGKKTALQVNFSEYTYLVAHYLTMDMISFIKEAPPSIHFTWEIYGWDLYNQFLTLKGFDLTSISTARFEKYGYLKKYLPNLFDLALYATGHNVNFTHQKRAAFDYICSRVNSLQYCCYYDAKYVEQYANRSINSYEIFNYSLKTVLGDLIDTPFFEGTDILIGNSASFTNNHMYIYKYIKDVQVNNDTRLIIPLSYGGPAKYVNDVKTLYSNKWPDKVDTLLDYMPLHEYNKMFLRLRCMILSAWRQESQGTAIMGFYLGIKVFMSERSPLYRWFKDCGFIVYSLEKSSESDYSRGLNEEEKLHNRHIVLERYNEIAFEETLKFHFK